MNLSALLPRLMKLVAEAVKHIPMLYCLQIASNLTLQYFLFEKALTPLY